MCQQLADTGGEIISYLLRREVPIFDQNFTDKAEARFRLYCLEDELEVDAPLFVPATSVQLALVALDLDDIAVRGVEQHLVVRVFHDLVDAVPIVVGLGCPRKG